MDAVDLLIARYGDPGVSDGPAAPPPLFDAGIDREAAGVDCPHAVTRTLQRGDATPFVASLRCKRNTCDACRRANAMGFLMRAEKGIGRALERGRTLATFDGEATAGAMSKRLRGVIDYLSYRHAGRRLAVATLAAGAQVPCGFEPATSDDAAAIMRTMQALAAEPAGPFAPEGKNVRPFATSKGWTWAALDREDDEGRDSLSSTDEEEQRKSAPPPCRVLAAHAAGDFHAIAEALRGIDFDGPGDPIDPGDRHGRLTARTFFDPVFRRNPRPGGRVQWCLDWNPIRELTAPEIQTVLAVLAALPREGP